MSAAAFDDDGLIYADLESQHYGPINYKAASIYALVKKDKKSGALNEVKNWNLKVKAIQKQELFCGKLQQKASES